MHRLELPRSRARDRASPADGACPLLQGDDGLERPERRRRHPQGQHQDRLGGRAGGRDRPPRKLRGTRCRLRRRPRRRVRAAQRLLGACLPARARRSVGKGQELRYVRALGAVRRDSGRDPGRARPVHVAHCERRAQAIELDQEPRLRRARPRQLHQPVHDPAARRRDLDRYARRRRPRPQTAALPRRRRRGSAAVCGRGLRRRYLVAGDVVELGIEGLGSSRQRLRAYR